MAVALVPLLVTAATVSVQVAVMAQRIQTAL